MRFFISQQRLSSKVIVTHDTLPDNVNVQYTSDCEGGDQPGDEGVCDKVTLGKEVSSVHKSLAKT